MPEPIPVIPLEYAASEEVRVDRTLGRLLLTAWVITAIGWVLMVIHVETAVASGPVLCVLGLMIAMMGVRRRRAWAAGIGAGDCAICALFVGLVLHFNWSPDEARVPFLLMGGVYVAISGVCTMLALRGGRSIL